MSARRLLLLPAAAVLLGLTACGAEAAPGLGPSASGSGAPGAPAAPAAEPAVATNCPSAAALQKLVELPKGQTFGRVQCVDGWAGADPQGPNTGDGVYLFHKAGTGWKYYGEGSGYDCKDLGLTKPAPFCIS